MRPTWILIVFLLIADMGLAANAESMFTPPPGNPLRKALMNTLRKPVMTALNQSIVFKVDWLRVKDGWAFMRGRPFQPNGSPVDYSLSPYQDAIYTGLFDDWFCALLQQEQGDWKVVVYNIGATDVVYRPWPKKYGAPREIFGFKN